MNKKALAIATALSLTAGGAAAAYAASTSSFTDVSANYWAKATIDWGASQHIVSGYPDHTFKPDNKVTEAEFLTMLISAFTQVDKSNATVWSDPFYNYSTKMNYPTNGASNQAARGWNITRQEVAEILSGASGFNYTGDNAVKFLLGKGLAKGKDPGDISVASYKASDYLTRAEAVQFIRTAKEKGLTDLKVRPDQPSDPSTIPAIPQQPAQPAQTVPILHEIKATDAGLTPLQKMALQSLLPRDAVSEPAIKAFLASVKFQNGYVTATIPSLPTGYTAYINLGAGQIAVKPGPAIRYSTSQYNILDFNLFKGYIGKNDIGIDLKTGEYSWGAHH